MNSYNNPFYRSLLGISEIDQVNSAQINTQNLTISSLGTGLVSSTSGALQNAIVSPPLEFKNNILTAQFYTGPTGFTGSTGSTGYTGYTGFTGYTGYTGETGFTGYTGFTGPTGSTGYIGSTGYTGPQSLITSNFNVFGGVNSGISRTTATGCVGLGYNALSNLTSSLNNTAVGTDTLKNLTINNVTQNGNNTAVGYASLSRCSTGFQNTAIGAFSGSTITTGRFNTLMGMSAGYNLTTGDTNFHLGLNSGFSNTTSNDNISIGAYSMARNLNQMTGTNGRNIAIGHYASHSLAFSPENNISIGYNSMYNATNCSDNIAIGVSAGNSLTTGGGNICIGGSSLSTGGTLTKGQGLNIGLGIASNLYISNGAVNNIGIGGYSNFNTSTGCNNIAIGTYTQALSATGCNNIVISTNGTSGTPISAKGDNTAFIDSRKGMFSYIPCCWWGYAVNQTGTILGWTKYASRNMELQTGNNTRLVLPYIGIYEITVSGSVNIGTANQNMNMYLDGSVYLLQPIFFTSAVGWTSSSLTAFVITTTVNQYVSYAMSGAMSTNTNTPFILCAKFISL